MKRNSGFSLVELMIVIVIIGVLAAVAVPIYSNNVMKAKMSEADAALGSIRTMLRVYYGENGEYINSANTAVAGLSGVDIKEAELAGKYFNAASYTYEGSADTFLITCAKGDILDADRTLSHVGDLLGGTL